MQQLHKKLEMISNKFNIKTVHTIFVLGATVVLISHILFSVGLYDGTDVLFYMILNNSFYFLESSRQLFKILQLLPAYVFIKFSSSSSIALLTQVFSFGLIWTHIISFLGCYFVLPKNKKNLIFFPLFSFFIGPVISLEISVSMALSVCSYVWFTAYVIYYTDLSNKIHKVLLFIVPLPLVLSHELMSYMAWPLIFLCWHKNKNEKNLFNKKLLWFVKTSLFCTSFVQIIMTLWHDTITGTTNDLNNIVHKVLHFDFLFKPSLNFLLIGSLFILLYSIMYMNRRSLNNWGGGRKIEPIVFYLVSISLIVIFFAVIFQIQKGFIPEYSIRFYSPIVALPCSLFLWYAHEQRKVNIKEIPKTFLFLCVLFFLTVMFFRLNFDYRFYKYQVKISEYVGKCEGVIKWERFKSSFKDMFDYELLQWHEWQIYYISLLYPRSNLIKSFILPYFSFCMRKCKRNLYKNCEKRCEEEQLHFFHKLKGLNKTRFFDTSEIENNISKSNVECIK